MKKLIFTLLALVGTMSMNAQIMKIMKNGEVIKTYWAVEADEVVFDEEPFGQGIAAATGVGYVKWVQLWADGPKFAEYNVGATSVEDYGGYYNWGKTTNKDTSGDYKSGTDALTGTDDTATNLWGSKWRMPTSAELSDTEGGLLHECDCTWTTNYNGTGKNGLLCTGRDEYSSNSVFLPAAGYRIGGNVLDQVYYGLYWSSTPFGSGDAYNLLFCSDYRFVSYDDRSIGYSVRAVLVEE